MLGSENRGPEIKEWLKRHDYFSENEWQHRVLFTLKKGKEEVVVVEGHTDDGDNVGVITVSPRGTVDIGLVVLYETDFADQVVSIVPPPSGETVSPWMQSIAATGIISSVIDMKAVKIPSMRW